MPKYPCEKKKKGRGAHGSGGFTESGVLNRIRRPWLLCIQGMILNDGKELIRTNETVN